jgi:hypothetical protein
MSSDDRIRNSSGIRNALLSMGAVMTLFYLGLGSMILFNKNFIPGIPVQFRNVFAGLLIVYGVYRGWRMYADHFKR